MSPKSRTKILVVDDEPDARIFLMNLLNADGFVPVTAAGKAEGLRKALDEKPSVIIINMMMPGEDGIHLFRKLKRHESLKRIPVIMLSTLDKNTFLKCHNIYGYHQPESDERLDAVLEKPLEADELLAVVRQLSAGPFATS